MPKFFALTLILATVSACTLIELPQTPAEFRQLVIDHPEYYAVSTHVAKQRFGKVISSLERSAGKCMNFNTRQTRTQGGMTTMSITDEYRTTIRRVDNNNAILTMQEDTKGSIQIQKIPPGGSYVSVVDIERLTANTTKVTFYGSGKTRFRAFVEQAASGKTVPCPN